MSVASKPSSAESEARGCPSREELQAYLEGRLSEARRQEILRHAATCPRCHNLEAAGDPADRETFSEEGRSTPIHLILGSESIDGEQLANAETRAVTGRGERASPAAEFPDFPQRYDLRRLLGRGGFGEVYEALDRELGRDVAVKLLRQDRIDDGNVALFREEARKLAQIRHRAVLEVYDVGRMGDRWYIVTPLVRGGTLLQRIQSGPLSVTEAVRIVIDVCDGLHAAHRKNIVHRDIKPANILLETSGQPRLTDFGLAVTEEEQLHEPHGPLGTVIYMSPEQVRGDSRYMDARSDVYAMGNVLYQALTARLPFVGRNREDWFEQICSRPPRPLRTLRDDVPAEIERICLKCLEKSPTDRYATADDLAKDLRRYLAGESRIFRRILIGAAVATGLLSVTIAGGAYFTRPVNPGTAAPKVAVPNVPAPKAALPIAAAVIQPAPQPNPEPVPYPEVLVWQESREHNTLVASPTTFVVNTKGVAVLALGVEGDQPTSLSVRIRAEPETRSWGIFHDYGRRRHVTSDALTLQTIEPGFTGEPFVVSGFRSFSADTPQNHFKGYLKYARCPNLDHDVRFDVTFHAGAILRLVINDQPLPALADPERDPTVLAPDSPTKFGIYVEKGSISLMDIRINGMAAKLSHVQRPQ